MDEPSIGNLFADLPTARPEELATILARSQHVRIERIVSTAHASPEGFWYDQDEIVLPLFVSVEIAVE